MNGQPWTEDDVELAVDMWMMGFSIPSIARALRRTLSATESAFSRLKIRQMAAQKIMEMEDNEP